MNSRHVFIASHIAPDGDAIGSIIAMGLLLNRLNKKTTIYNPDAIPAVYRFLPCVDLIRNHVDCSDKWDMAVILDCADISRVGNMASALLNHIPVVINIDHHITNTGFGTLKFVDTSACATSEIVYRLAKELTVPIDMAIATSIYTGILTDTGSFRFANTNKAAFAICNEMVAAGANPYHVAKHVYGTYSLGRIKLLNRALDSLEISKNGKVSIMTLTKDMFCETGTHPEDIDGMISYARRIENIRIAVLIQEYENGNKGKNISRFHVSLRSDGSVDVAKIAAGFGGGGHSNAAGFNIESSIAELKKEIFQSTEEIMD